ncbi:FesM [Phototrophicus methaneseepsis]|uniref:FesM n=1 Tax=Phototrophicus methaneseepsis TaxID=2710758 RepID=A0A7S8E8X2_9CHLR|nr:FesM [Phototrophicus methaneseepsis]QPC82414.1 FesM [Phototrophicus methaneseepsis]
MANRTPLYRPRSAVDVLRIPLLGRLLKHPRGRLLLQGPFFLVAVLLLIDGFTGPSLASRNLATVAPWVHYRGLVIIALLIAGNLFCMGCPFTVTRTLARRLSKRGRRFPKVLRNKWLAIAGLFVIFFLYEWLDLWASPLLTAWVIVGYFAASFVLELVFTESAFCKYVCPLGTFNFVYATAAPSQIGVHDANICAHCVGKECINGSYAPQTTIRVDEIPVASGGTVQKEVVHSPNGVLGCGTELFPPQLKSNLDCVYCLDCARACPHDNVGLFIRQPGRELHQAGAWSQRWDVSLLVIALAFMGLSNAFGMVPPVFDLMDWLRETIGIQSEFVALVLIFGVGNILLPFGSAMLAGTLSRLLTRNGRSISLRHTVAAFAPAFVPLGAGIWFAHYSFHFLIAPLSIIPVLQEFFGQVGDWARFSAAPSAEFIGALQVVALVGGFAWSMIIAQKAALRLYKRDGLLGLLPWALLLLVMMFAAIQIFGMPMEMRGTDFMA